MNRKGTGSKSGNGRGGGGGNYPPPSRQLCSVAALTIANSAKELIEAVGDLTEAWFRYHLDGLDPRGGSKYVQVIQKIL